MLLKPKSACFHLSKHDHRNNIAGKTCFGGVYLLSKAIQKHDYSHISAEKHAQEKSKHVLTLYEGDGHASKRPRDNYMPKASISG